MSKNKVSAKSLREQALGFVKEKAAANVTRGGRKQMFHEMLLNNKMKRSDVIFEIAMKVYDNEFPGSEELNTKVFQRVHDSVKKSVAIYCRRSFSESTASATYNGDKAFNGYHLRKDGNMLEIIEEVIRVSLWVSDDTPRYNIKCIVTASENGNLYLKPDASVPNAPEQLFLGMYYDTITEEELYPVGTELMCSCIVVKPVNLTLDQVKAAYPYPDDRFAVRDWEEARKYDLRRVYLIDYNEFE